MGCKWQYSGQSHSKEDRGLHEGQTMDEIGLGNAGIQADLLNDPP